MPYTLLHLQVHQVFLAVVVRIFTQSVIPTETMDVPRKCGKIGARKELRAAADDGLDHAVRVGVDALQPAAAQKVT